MGDFAYLPLLCFTLAACPDTKNVLSGSGQQSPDTSNAETGKLELRADRLAAHSADPNKPSSEMLTQLQGKTKGVLLDKRDLLKKGAIALEALSETANGYADSVVMNPACQLPKFFEAQPTADSADEKSGLACTGAASR